MKNNHLLILGLLWLSGILFCSTMAVAKPVEKSFDLAGLIECKKQIGDYNELAMFLTAEREAAKALGWKELKSANSFLREYQLKASITVFGFSTSKIAFGGSSINAVLEGTTPQALAQRLNLEKFIETPNKAMFFKNILEKKDAAYTDKITLNVSSIETHPKQVLAGCDYRVEVH